MPTHVPKTSLECSQHLDSGAALIGDGTARERTSVLTCDCSGPRNVTRQPHKRTTIVDLSWFAEAVSATIDDDCGTNLLYFGSQLRSTPP